MQISKGSFSHNSLDSKVVNDIFTQICMFNSHNSRKISYPTSFSTLFHKNFPSACRKNGTGFCFMLDVGYIDNERS